MQFLVLGLWFMVALLAEALDACARASASEHEGALPRFEKCLFVSNPGLPEESTFTGNSAFRPKEQ